MNFTVTVPGALADLKMEGEKIENLSNTKLSTMFNTVPYQTSSVDLSFFVGLSFGQKIDIIRNWTPMLVVQVDFGMQTSKFVQPVRTSPEVSERDKQINFQPWSAIIYDHYHYR